MIREKPKIDRAQLILEARVQAQARQCLDQMTGLLCEGERFGEPRRQEGRIVVPILREGRAPDPVIPPRPEPAVLEANGAQQT